MKKMNKLYKITLFLSLLLAVPSLYAGDFPEKPTPPRLVNDLAGFLTQQENNRLESKLEQFARETSTQIAIAIVPDLHGYDPGDYAARLAEKWGVGQKGKENGILILVKPKTPQGFQQSQEWKNTPVQDSREQTKMRLLSRFCRCCKVDHRINVMRFKYFMNE
jgi:hypothetical protein